jgi:hypothetical protein
MAVAAGTVDNGHARVFGLDVNGDGHGTRVAVGEVRGVSLEQAVRSGDPAFTDIRIAYDMHARANGFDPTRIPAGSPEDRQVLADLTRTLQRVATEAPQARGGVASQIETLRAQARQTVHQRQAEAATGLSGVTLAAAARAPGAAAAAELPPEAATAARIAIRHPAAAAGFVVGAGVAISAGQFGRTAETPTAERDRVDIRVAADTNRDGELQCREIGQWQPEAGYAARETINGGNANRYQDYVGGRPGENFHVTAPGVRNVAFDGCRDIGQHAVLVEAKGDHGVLLSPHAIWSDAPIGIEGQGRDQQEAATVLGVRNEWHVQTAHDTAAIAGIFTQVGIATPVLHDPMPPGPR